MFIVEVLRALAEESGGLEAIGQKTLPRHVFSGGVEAVVQRRLGRVPPWTQPLLRLAAIAGRRIDRELLSTLEPQLDAWLQACTDAAVLEVSESEWRFAHDKLRERLLATIPEPERRSLHRQVAEAIERLHTEENRPDATLAHHFDEAKESIKAEHYAARAGAAALRTGALHEARGLLERAAALQEQLGRSPLERARTLRRLSRVLLGLGLPVDGMQQVRKTMALLGQPIPQSRPARTLALLREAGIELRHRLAAPSLATDPEQRTLTQEFLTLVRGTYDAFFVTKGHQDEALLVMLRGLHAAENIGDTVEQQTYLSWLAYAFYVAPLHSLGRLYLNQALRLVDKGSDQLVIATTHAMSAYIFAAEGLWEKSDAAFSAWLNQVVSTGDLAQQGLALQSRLGERFLSCDLAGASADITESLAVGERLGNQMIIATATFWKGALLFRRGDVERAYQFAQETQRQLSQSGSTMHRVALLSLQAIAAAMAGWVEQAAEHVDAALLGMVRLAPASPVYHFIYEYTVLACFKLAKMAATPEQQAASEQRLRKAISHMYRFARIFPIGWPVALLSMGKYLALHGQHRLGLLLLKQGLGLCRRYHMRLEEAQAHLFIAELGISAKSGHLMSQDTAKGHLQTACDLFRKLNSVCDLAEAEQLMFASFSNAPGPNQSPAATPFPFSS